MDLFFSIRLIFTQNKKNLGHPRNNGMVSKKLSHYRPYIASLWTIIFAGDSRYLPPTVSLFPQNSLQMKISGKCLLVIPLRLYVCTYPFYLPLVYLLSLSIISIYLDSPVLRICDIWYGSDPRIRTSDYQNRILHTLKFFCLLLSLHVHHFSKKKSNKEDITKQ